MTSTINHKSASYIFGLLDIMAVLLINAKMNQNINVGIDTGKFQPDIYIGPLDIYFFVTNDEKGIQEAVSTIKTQT
jgi:hypothetical protein